MWTKLYMLFRIQAPLYFFADDLTVAKTYKVPTTESGKVIIIVKSITIRPRVCYIRQNLLDLKLFEFIYHMDFIISSRDRSRLYH